MRNIQNFDVLKLRICSPKVSLRQKPYFLYPMYICFSFKRFLSSCCFKVSLLPKRKTLTHFKNHFSASKRQILEVHPIKAQLGPSTYSLNKSTPPKSNGSRLVKLLQSKRKTKILAQLVHGFREGRMREHTNPQNQINWITELDFIDRRFWLEFLSRR